MVRAPTRRPPKVNGAVIGSTWRSAIARHALAHRVADDGVAHQRRGRERGQHALSAGLVMAGGKGRDASGDEFDQGRLFVGAVVLLRLPLFEDEKATGGQEHHDRGDEGRDRDSVFERDAARPDRRSGFLLVHSMRPR
jgi:hypothetical protein